MKNALSNSWNPLRELEDFQNRILGAFNPGTATSYGMDRGKRLTPVADWVPLADIAEDAEGYHITLELPQVKKEDVKVTVENGALTISGERRFDKEEADGRKYHRLERAYGCFARSFALPEDSNTDNVEAQYDNGMLNIRIGKSEAARPKHIEVKVN